MLFTLNLRSLLYIDMPSYHAGLSRNFISREVFISFKYNYINILAKDKLLYMALKMRKSVCGHNTWTLVCT